MAPITIPQTTTSNHPSILSLEKSEDSFPVQVDTACGILGIDLGGQWKAYLDAGSDREERQTCNNDPRPSYALRWLLKKLQSAEENPNLAFSYYKAWFLLRVLLVRLPISTAARLLREHKITGILRKTFEWILEHKDGRLGSSVKKSEGGEEASDSSYDTAKTSQSALKASRKRKREDSEYSFAEEDANRSPGESHTLKEPSNEDSESAAVTLRSPSPNEQRFDVRYLHLAVCSVVILLGELSSESSESSDEWYAVEHLKFVSRTSPEDAASVLGRSLYITNQIIRNSGKGSSSKKLMCDRLANPAYSNCVYSLVAFWEKRFLRSQDRSDGTSNREFSKNCLLPCLQLASTCGEMSDSHNEAKAVEQLLQDLVVKHIIMPFRAQVSIETRHSESQAEDASEAFKSEIVSAFQGFKYPHPADSGSSDSDSDYNKERESSKIASHLVITMLSTLFKTAINCCQRNTVPQRRAEGLWLQELFSQLLKCAATPLPHASLQQIQKSHARLARWLLRHSLNHGLRLSSSELEPLLDHDSGLFAKEDSYMDWELISLCLQVEASLFTSPTLPANCHESYGYRAPNKYLTSLLSKLTKQGSGLTSEHFSNYQSILSEVVLPLASAFAIARDLSGFVGHWREQLDNVEKQQNEVLSSHSYPQHLWEDDRLIKHVAGLISVHLTADQINQILHMTEGHLAICGADSDPTAPKASKFLASLVTINAVIIGIVHEDQIISLERTALSIYSIVQCLFDSISPMKPIYRWRLWRILATISDQWKHEYKWWDSRQSSFSLISRATSLITQVPTWNVSIAELEAREVLHAFRFLLGFTEAEDHYRRDIQSFSSREKIRHAVDVLVSVMEPFISRIAGDHFETVKAHPAAANESPSPSHIICVEVLYLKCMNYLVNHPAILEHLEKDTQERLIEQLYWCAVYHQRSLIKTVPSFSSPWQGLLQRNLNKLGGSFSGCLCDYRVKRYLEASTFNDPKFWNMMTADHDVAFESIQILSPGYLNREQRSLLANRALRVLLHANISSIAQRRDYLTVLCQLFTMPNKSMNVFSTVCDSQPEGGKDADAIPTLIMLASQIDSAVSWSNEHVQSVETLLMLVREVMKYLLSTLHHERSVVYMKQLHNYVAKLLERKVERSEICTIAVSAVIGMVLNSRPGHRELLPKALDEAFAKNETSRQKHLDICIKSLPLLQGCLGKLKQRHEIGISLDCLIEYSDLLLKRPDLSNATSPLRLIFDTSFVDRQIEKRRFESEDQLTSTNRTSYGIDQLYVHLRNLRLVLESCDPASDYSLHQTLGVGSLIRPNMTPEEQHSVERLINDAVRKRTPGEKGRWLQLLFDEGARFSEPSLILITAIFLSLREAEVEELRPRLTKALIFLCNYIPKLTQDQHRQGILILQSLHLALQNLPQLISQWHIDSLIATVTVKSSQLETQKDRHQSAMIYTALCRIFSIILVLHRPKIGGRYHLLLPALQSLLRCLFTPYTSLSDIKEATSVLTSDHAKAYGRLLTTLADPTVSSVTRSKKRSRHDLNDETAKARSIAGQYLPYLIMEYCVCQLKGRLEPNMKAALEPGLFVVLNVITKEAMQTINAVLDEGGRAIWKALYEDWKRSKG